MRTKKILTVVLAIAMLLQTFVISGFAVDTSGFIDFPDDWSTEAMTAAVENGLLEGTSPNTIEPSKKLTRAEFAAFISRAFGATVEGDIKHFKDVSKDDWFYSSVAKSYQMGVMFGTGADTFSPNAYMKRGDVFLSIARLLFVSNEDTSVLDEFSDKDKIDSWSVQAIAGLVHEGYISGYEDGTLKTNNNITRAELAQLFHNMFSTYISEPGEYTSVAKNGSVVVRSEDVILKDVTVNGDLIIADGVGDGDFTLENVEVLGKIIVRGGEGTVSFVGVESKGNVIINDVNGTVNFHNYRTDVPFFENLVENTRAIFLEKVDDQEIKPSTSGSSGSGGGGSSSSTKKTLIFEIDDRGDDIEKVTLKNSPGYVITYDDVPDIDEIDETFLGWAIVNGGRVGSIVNNGFFVDRTLRSVVGSAVNKKTYSAIYEYTVIFHTDDGDVEEIKVKSYERIDEDDIPETPAGIQIGWTRNDNLEDPDENYSEITSEELADDALIDILDDFDIEKGERVLELYPAYKDYSVKFVDYEENELETYTIVGRQTLDEVPSPYLLGYDLLGWSLEKVDKDSADNASAVDFTEDELLNTNVEDIDDGDTSIVLYPVYGAKTYNITFTRNGETIGTASKKANTKLEEAEVPVAAIPGWSSDEWVWVFNGTPYTNDELLNTNVEVLFEEVDKDYTGTIEVELSATMEALTYDVTFKYVIDGNETIVATMEKIAGTVLSAPGEAEVEATSIGYDFESWQYGAKTLSPEDISADVIEKVFLEDYAPVLVANLVAKTYSVKFMDGTDEIGEDSAEAGNVLENVPDASKVGYDFENWTYNGEDVTSDDLENKNVEELFGNDTEPSLEAVYTPWTYEITFVDGADEMGTDTVVAGNKAANVPETDKTGYTFVGFTYGGEDITDALENDVVEDIFGEETAPVVEAVYTPWTYEITFVDGADEIGSDSVVAGNKVVSIPETDKMGFTFVGFEFDGEDITDALENDVVEDIFGEETAPVVEAVYEAWTYEITFVDGADEMGTDTVLAGNKAANVPETEKTGFTFVKWTFDGEDITDALENDNVEDIFGEETAPVVEAEYEAWTYEITFYDDDEVTVLDTITIEAGNVIDAMPEDPDRMGYDFAAWWYDGEVISGVTLLNYEVQEIFGEETEPEIFASYSPWLYTINFYEDASTLLDTVEIYSGNKIASVPEVDVENMTFLGWSETEGATSAEYTSDELVADNVEALFGEKTEIDFYAVLAMEGDGFLTVEHYFEQLDGSYTLEETDPDEEVLAGGTAVEAVDYVIESESHEVNLLHADNVLTGTITSGATTTLKLYYDLVEYELYFYDMGEPIHDDPIMVKHGSTFADYEDEIADTLDGYSLWYEIGYGKSYDDVYVENNVSEDGYGDELDEENNHAIHYNWYIATIDGEEFEYEEIIRNEENELETIGTYSDYAEDYVFTRNTDVYAKVKDLIVIVEMPELVEGEQLTLHIPYEDDTRFIDSIRDGVFYNAHVTDFVDRLKLEEKIMTKLEDANLVELSEDDEYEIKNVNSFMVEFYKMMGGKEAFAEWLWDIVEDEVKNELNDEWLEIYEEVKDGRGSEEALRDFFEYGNEHYDGVAPADAVAKYYASERFVEEATHDEEFAVTKDNEFIMLKVDEKISSLRYIDDVINEYAGDRIPERLVDKLPKEELKHVYEREVEEFLVSLEDAIDHAHATGEEVYVESGIVFDVNLVEDLLIPLYDYAVNMHQDVVDKTIESDRREAEIFAKIYSKNDYAPGLVAFADPEEYLTKVADRDRTDSTSGYKIRAFAEIYEEVLKPASVQTADALLWIADADASGIDFDSDIRPKFEDNKHIIISVNNHLLSMSEDYAENGFPEDLNVYYDDLVSNEYIEKALEGKLPDGIQGYIEKLVNNNIVENVFVRILNKFGVKGEALLGQMNGRVVKELDEETFDEYLDEVSLAFEESDEGVVNGKMTTDHVIGKMESKIDEENSLKGVNVIYYRTLADSAL